jgi:hypothetical protein
MTNPECLGANIKSERLENWLLIAGACVGLALVWVWHKPEFYWWILTVAVAEFLHRISNALHSIMRILADSQQQLLAIAGRMGRGNEP